MKASGRSMVFNQKDMVAGGGASKNDISNKKRMGGLNSRTGAASSVLDRSLDDSGSDDGFTGGNDFLAQLEDLQRGSPPDRVLEQYQQMQDDLIELRYFIQQHYSEVVEIPGMQRAE